MLRLIFAASMLALLGTALLPETGRAQGPHLGFSVTDSATTTKLHESSLVPEATGLIGSGANDHRYTGMYVGLGMTALVGVFSLAYCGDSDNSCDTSTALLRIPITAIVLGGIGAMIGRAIPKDSPEGVAPAGR